MGMFYNDYDGSTNIGTNGLLFRAGDTITVSGITDLTGPAFKPWSKVNGTYYLEKIGTLHYGAKAFLVSDRGRTPNWGTGSLNVSSFEGVHRLTSSSGAVVERSKKYSMHFVIGGTFETIPPKVGLAVLILWIHQDTGPTIVLDDPVMPDAPNTPNNPPTTPTAPPNTPTTPTSPPTTPTPPPSIVKRVGTTVTIPFLTRASFKPGTDARANERGKAAFIKAVQAASKASNLNKAQSDQLMADVIKAIKDSELTRRKLTPLKGKK